MFRLIVPLGFASMSLGVGVYASDKNLPSTQESSSELIAFPASINEQCNDGSAAVFDECGDQLALFDAALAKSNSEAKQLLVVFGAEWCIWAHAFDKHIKGVSGAFTHVYSDPDGQEWFKETLYERDGEKSQTEAKWLARFVADNFVVVYIEGAYSPNGWEVLRKTKAETKFDDWIPFVFTVTSDGEFAEAFNRTGIETRRDTDDWWRGYDRMKLIEALRSMKASAIEEGKTL